MKSRMGKRSITFSDIYNESQYESVMMTAKSVGAKVEVKDFNTKVVVTGSVQQLNDFVTNWNKMLRN